MYTFKISKQLISRIIPECNRGVERTTRDEAEGWEPRLDPQYTLIFASQPRSFYVL
jgi:hypothetical protein